MTARGTYPLSFMVEGDLYRTRPIFEHGAFLFFKHRLKDEYLCAVYVRGKRVWMAKLTADGYRKMFRYLGT